MAVIVTPLLTTVHDASTTTGWTADGGWGSLATDNAIFRHGGTALRGQVSQGPGHVYYTLGTPVNLTSITNRRVYAWLLPPGSFGTLADGGLRIVIGDGTNRAAYYVGGNDVNLFTVGAWYSVSLDANNKPSGFATLAGSEASIDWTAITQIGIGINNPAKATGNSPNAWFDIIRYGRGLRITGGGVGTEGKFAEIADADASTDNAWGILREIQSGVFGLQGNLTFGDTASTDSVNFKDDGVILVIEDNVKGPGTNTPMAISGVGNSTGTTSVELGIPVGTGDEQRGRSGVTFVNANINQSFGFDFTNTNVDIARFYGCVWKGFSAQMWFSEDATHAPNHRLSGCSMEECGQFRPGRVVVRNCVFSSFTGFYTASEAALLWNDNINIKNCQFLANSDLTVDAAGIEHPLATAPYTYDNLTFAGNDFDIFNSSGSTVTINATNGSNPATTRGDPVDILNAVIVRVTVVDEAGDPVPDASVYVQDEAGPFDDDSEILRGFTDLNGVAETSFNYAGDLPIIYRIRKTSPSSPRYFPFEGSGTITASGFTATARLIEDPIASS